MPRRKYIKTPLIVNCQLSINPAVTQAFLTRGSEKIDKFNFSLAPQRQLSIIIRIFARKNINDDA